MTPNEKADAAKQLLDSTILKAVFADIRESMVSRLEGTGITDTAEQHEITLMLQVLKRVQSMLHKYIGDQVIEKHRAKQDEFLAKTRETLT